MKKYFVLVIVATLVFSACASKKPIEGIEKLNVPVTANYAEAKAVPYDDKVQVVAFNIEQGHYWSDVDGYIAAQRDKMPATICLLSETDRMHSRTGDIFVADQMARSLKLNMIFVTEFIEYNDKTKDTPGDHGNAILSPFPLSDIAVIRHTDVWSWTKWGWTQGQPRKGERVTIGATAALPGGKKIRVYEAHLESAGQSFQRWVQMREILDDAKKYDLPVVIGGDFNDLPSGVILSRIKDYGFANAYEGDKHPTGGCMAEKGKVRCTVKIDWQIYRNLKVADRFVDYPANSKGGTMSDHAPVRVLSTLP
jgi:endonuclease/exonuclease/phosphatase family metal-dependent hydrolase